VSPPCPPLLSPIYKKKLTQPTPRLSKLDGDWHEFESKALRKENERKEKEARRLQKDKGDKDKKRVSEDAVEGRDSKRINSGMGPPPAVPGAKAAVG
jgi:CTD kinase subunit alpha